MGITTDFRQFVYAERVENIPEGVMLKDIPYYAKIYNVEFDLLKHLKEVRGSLQLSISFFVPSLLENKSNCV